MLGVQIGEPREQLREEGRAEAPAARSEVEIYGGLKRVGVGGAFPKRPGVCVALHGTIALGH